MHIVSFNFSPSSWLQTIWRPCLSVFKSRFILYVDAWPETLHFFYIIQMHLLLTSLDLILSEIRDQFSPPSNQPQWAKQTKYKIRNEKTKQTTKPKGNVHSDINGEDIHCDLFLLIFSYYCVFLKTLAILTLNNRVLIVLRWLLIKHVERTSTLIVWPCNIIRNDHLFDIVRLKECWEDGYLT